MTIKQLYYFCEVCQTMNMTQAASHLYISQTSMTKSIQLLEEELGMKLFSREHKHLSLTPEGLFFYEEAKKIIQSYEKMQQDVSLYKRGETGILDIGYIKNFDIDYLVALSQTFSLAYPDIQLRFHSYSNKIIHEKIKEGLLHFGIGFPMDRFQEEYHYQFLKDYPLAYIVNQQNPLAIHETLNIKAIDQSSLLFDARHYNADTAREYEDVVLKVACNQGTAIFHSFDLAPQFSTYIKTILLDNTHAGVYLIYDDHPNRLKDLFVTFASSFPNHNKQKEA